jgi:ABC-type Fe3+ transport system substrate-binding protein
MMKLMITGNENLLQLSEMSRELIPIFEKQGLGSYFKPENLSKIGRYTRLNSLLQAKNIEKSQFIASLNQVLSDTGIQKTCDLFQIQHNLHFAAMLPCGLRNPFKEYFESMMAENPDRFSALNYLIEGNVNHELSYYPLLDGITDSKELPDIIMASDVNNFFHRPFLERFIQKDVFQTYTPFSPNAYLEKAEYADPAENFTMYTSNMLIMVVDKQKLGKRKMPEKWDDLLAPEFENDLIMRGEENFFCNAILLPFFKDKGFESIEILAKNIKSGMHPAEMVKLAGKNAKEGAAIYIMPYFFAKRIQNKNAEIIWPQDGAIVSPVFLLVKKDKIKEHQFLLDFLLSEKTGNMLTGRYFPSIHPEVSHDTFPQNAKWLGWDFLNKHDIGQVKNEIRDVFLKVWNAKTTAS